MVDETSHTYQLQSEKALPHTETEGNVTVDKKVVIYCDSDSKSINETDNGAKLIRKYTVPMKLDRVYKDELERLLVLIKERRRAKRWFCSFWLVEIRDAG